MCVGCFEDQGASPVRGARAMGKVGSCACLCTEAAAATGAHADDECPECAHFHLVRSLSVNGQVTHFRDR